MTHCVSFSDYLPELVSGPFSSAANAADNFFSLMEADSLTEADATVLFSPLMDSTVLEPNDATSGSMMSSWENPWYFDDGSACSTPTSHDIEMKPELNGIWQQWVPAHGLLGGGHLPDRLCGLYPADDEQMSETQHVPELNDPSHANHHKVMENTLPAAQFNSLQQIAVNAQENATEISRISEEQGDQIVCIHVFSDDPALHDGYVWRKYGQKDIKGKRFPRSYFKCAQPGCSIKKQTEASSDGDGIIVIKYIGRHNHSN